MQTCDAVWISMIADAVDRKVHVHVLVSARLARGVDGKTCQISRSLQANLFPGR